MKKVRVALFGSFYRGFYVLHELLYGDISSKVEVVGVATDDPSKSFASPHKRVWQYPHTVTEEKLVKMLASSHNIPVYDGKVKSKQFYNIFERIWKPEICIMATFGQKINARLFNYPRLGFYNLHPSFDDNWPSYPGPNSFQELINDRKPYTVIAMHIVDGDFDTGKLIARTRRIPIPPRAIVIDLHKITSPIAAEMVAQELKKIVKKYHD